MLSKNSNYKLVHFSLTINNWDILKRKIKDRKLLWLTREIMLSTEGMLDLPLGNYTSQMSVKKSMKEE